MLSCPEASCWNSVHHIVIFCPKLRGRPLKTPKLSSGFLFLPTFSISCVSCAPFFALLVPNHNVGIEV